MWNASRSGLAWMASRRPSARFPAGISSVTLVKALGLLIIGLSAASAALALGVPNRPARIVCAVHAAVLWTLALLAFSGLLAVERSSVGTESFLCPVPGQDSSYVSSHWSWIPPGEVCEYASGDVGPTYWRIPAAMLLVAIPLGAIMGLAKTANPHALGDAPADRYEGLERLKRLLDSGALTAEEYDREKAKILGA